MATSAIGNDVPLSTLSRRAEDDKNLDIQAEVPPTYVEHHTKKDNAGNAVIEQRGIIPSTGKRVQTKKIEYICFCIFYFSNNGAPILTNAGSLRQALTNQEFPNSIVNWNGNHLPLSSYILDLTGIQFAIQMVILLLIGPYADYGSWRPWILIGFQSVLYVCQFAMCGMKNPSEWQAANAIYLIGSVSANIVTAFYAATFPGLVRDLPRLIRCEEEVRIGQKRPEEYEALDAYERSKMYNYVNITGSVLVVIFTGMSIGISAGIGYTTDAQVLHTYRVLMGVLGAVTVLCTVPFFIVQQHRPGQQLPRGTNWYAAGPQQVWSALKAVRRLKHCLLYLLSYWMIQEVWSGVPTGVLQSQTIHYSPLVNNALGLISDLCGGSGTVACLLLQKKFRFTIKQGCFYGACAAVAPSVWGFAGYFTNTVGFHHSWEFWLAAAWNFQTAAWGSYAITMISEVVPAPKTYMFFALFNTVGKTSGFIGPFVSSALINRANNTWAAYSFTMALGLCGIIVLTFVNTDQAKIDNAKYLEDEAQALYSEEQRDEGKARNLEYSD